MDKEFGREIRVYDGKAYGYKVSNYGLENGYLDYHLARPLAGPFYFRFEQSEKMFGLNEN